MQGLPSVAPVIATGNQETQLEAEFTIFVPDNEAWVELNADIQALNESTVSQACSSCPCIRCVSRLWRNGDQNSSPALSWWDLNVLT